jgi:CHAT domain-containing protein
LSRTLLGGIADLARKKRLVIVAEDALHRVPFAALVHPGSSVPLIETHEVVSLPSASMIEPLRRRRSTPSKTMALFADPVFSGNDPRLRRMLGPRAPVAGAEELPLHFARLVFSRQEGSRISALGSPDEIHSRYGFEATRQAALDPSLASYRIVHFSTHGVVHPEFPEFSGIVLSLVDAKGRTQDGFVRLFEIYRRPLAADLVVVSACHSGAGPNLRGEGIVGLAHGFLWAGARRVVVSLWQVNDEASAELMVQFYRHVLEEGLAPADALRRAQGLIRKLARWSDPHYWSGFVLQGEWR